MGNHAKKKNKNNNKYSRCDRPVGVENGNNAAEDAEGYDSLKDILEEQHDASARDAYAET